MNINNINIKVSDRKQKELLNKAEDLVDTVSSIKVTKIAKNLSNSLHLFRFELGSEIQQKLFASHCSPLSYKHILGGRHSHVAPVERTARLHFVLVGLRLVRRHPIRHSQSPRSACSMRFRSLAQACQLRCLRSVRCCCSPGKYLFSTFD